LGGAVLSDESFLRKQALEFFNTHASQRMSLFNFYVVLSGAIIAAYFASFKAEMNVELARPALGMLLSLFSYVFWKLDQRNDLLLDVARQALISFEANDPESPGKDMIRVFTKAEERTRKQRDRRWKQRSPWHIHFRYRECFGLVFAVFFTVGVAGTLVPIIHWLRTHC